MHKALHNALASITDPAPVVACAAKLGLSTEDLVLLGIGRTPAGKLAPAALEGAAAYWRDLPHTAERLAEAFPYRCPMCTEVGPIHRPTPPERCKGCTMPRCATCAKLSSCQGCEALESLERTVKHQAEKEAEAKQMAATIARAREADAAALARLTAPPQPPAPSTDEG